MGPADGAVRAKLASARELLGDHERLAGVEVAYRLSIISGHRRSVTRRACAGVAADSIDRLVSELAPNVATYPAGPLPRVRPRAPPPVECCGRPVATGSPRVATSCAACGCVVTVDSGDSWVTLDVERSRGGAQNPNRHFQKWWMHITATEPDEELGNPRDPDNLRGEKVIVAMRLLVREKQRVLRHVTVPDVRRMLVQLRRTSLNENVPLIMRRLTGVGPPVLPDTVAARVEHLFTRAIAVEVGDSAGRPGRTNRKYYPYYLLKILDQILVAPEERRILYYIHLQSGSTVWSDDTQWRAVCAAIDDLEYRPTRRDIGSVYRPT